MQNFKCRKLTPSKKCCKREISFNTKLQSIIEKSKKDAIKLAINLNLFYWKGSRIDISPDRRAPSTVYYKPSIRSFQVNDNSSYTFGMQWFQPCQSYVYLCSNRLTMLESYMLRHIL